MFLFIIIILHNYYIIIIYVSDVPNVPSACPTGILRRMASFSVSKITGQSLEKLAMAVQR